MNQLDSKLSNNNYLTKMFNQLSDKTKIILINFLQYFEDIDILNALGVESPIEEILLISIEIYCKIFEFPQICLLPQFEIETNNKKYRADFVYFEDEYINTEYNSGKKIVIECDGHEFHQKTKKQVEKDNEREYDLKMVGYEILRFSGSQIYNEPLTCAEKIYRYIKQKS